MPTRNAIEIALASFLLVCVGALSLFPRRALRSGAWSLLRCLWPSWRFFDVPAPLPSLRVRIAPTNQDYGEYRDVLAAPRRGASSLFLNARHNLELAYASAVETLADELSGDEPSVDPTSYEVVRRLVELRARGFDATVQRYQFALFEAGDAEPWFISEPHVVNAE